MGRGEEYMGMVAELPCATCGDSPVEVHHCRQGDGMGKHKKNPFLTAPLCPDCHRGPNGVHGTKVFMRLRKMDEWDLVADTVEKIVFREIGK